MAISLVGTIGSVVVGTSGSSLTPTWGSGESRSAGNLLVCWVTGTGHSPTPVANGWSLASVSGYSSPAYFTSAILYKVATGADAAPTITASTGLTWYAQLGEFNGTSANPLVRAVNASSSTQSVTATSPVADPLSKNLIITSTAFYRNIAAVTTINNTLNNGASSVNTNNSSSNVTQNYSFGYGLTTGNSSPDSQTISWTGGGSGSLASITNLATFEVSGELITGAVKIQGISSIQL
jgi:hypothetical protein